MKIIIEIADNETLPSVAVDTEFRPFDNGVILGPEAEVHVQRSDSTEEIVVDAGPAGQPLELDANASVTSDNPREETGEEN